MEDLYYSLRGEIRYNQEQENIICMFCYTTCVAMLAFAYSEHIEMVAFLSQLAFLPFAYNLELYPFFTDKLRDLAFPYSKSMI